MPPSAPGLQYAAHPAMSRRAAAAQFASPRAIRAPMLWGIVVGLLQAATPLAFWWLDSATVYALGLVVIAPVYIGFAVADGRPKIIAAESSVTFAFVSSWPPPRSPDHRGCSWPASPGTASRTSGNTAPISPTHDGGRRSAWSFDWVVAAIIAGEIAAGMHFG